MRAEEHDYVVLMLRFDNGLDFLGWQKKPGLVEDLGQDSDVQKIRHLGHLEQQRIGRVLHCSSRVHPWL